MRKFACVALTIVGLFLDASAFGQSRTPRIEVIDPTNGAARVVLVKVDGVLYSVRTTPVIPQDGTPDPSPIGPTPTPTPAPEPPPVPTVAGRVWIYYLLPASPTPAQAAVKTAAPIREAATKNNMAWLSYTVGDAEVGQLNLSQFVDELGTPCVVFVDETTGEVVAKKRSPTVTDVVGLIVQLRGR